jgi:hypothetical protein
MPEKLPPLLLYWVLDKDGRTPVPTDNILAWADCNDNYAQRQVAVNSKDGGDLVVSTVFFGINEELIRGAQPSLFLCNVFRNSRQVAQRRYQTWDQAARGHREVCKEYGVECSE